MKKEDNFKNRNLWEWLNQWANYSKHKECIVGKYHTPYGDGYKQAVRDIMERLEDDNII